MRAKPNAPAPAVYLFWGPHSAGHQNPAALHLDIHSGRRRLTDAPHTAGYGDPMHLTWQRTTVAHNTVTVDRRPMFPYETGEEDSIWWSDEQKGRKSDGRLEAFLPEGPTKILRASNERVYPGVQLDRTVALERDYVLDVYRISAEETRTFDWTMHCVGAPPEFTPAEPVDMGDERGYRHLEDARRWTGNGEPPRLTWGEGDETVHLLTAPPEDAELIVAADPPAPDKKVLGRLEPVGPRSSVMMRTRGTECAFIALWTFGDGGEAAKLFVEKRTPRGNIDVNISTESTERRLHLPLDPDEMG
jgi:hypothetical protein